MKKLKSIDVTVTYSVRFYDIDLPENVYNNMIALYDSGVYQFNLDTVDGPAGDVCDWLSDNMRESDAYSVCYEIDDFDDDHEENL